MRIRESTVGINLKKKNSWSTDLDCQFASSSCLNLMLDFDLVLSYRYFGFDGFKMLLCINWYFSSYFGSFFTCMFSFCSSVISKLFMHVEQILRDRVPPFAGINLEILKQFLTV